jgi:hypothetical protein
VLPRCRSFPAPCSSGDTRDTAVGLYALIQQLESALRSDLQQLVQRLEPGR